MLRAIKLMHLFKNGLCIIFRCISPLLIYISHGYIITKNSISLYLFSIHWSWGIAIDVLAIYVRKLHFFRSVLIPFNSSFL